MRQGKLNLKLEQQKMLAIVTPDHSLVGMDAVKRNRSSHKNKCDFCGEHLKKWTNRCTQLLEKSVIKCSGKNHFKVMCRSSKGLEQKVRHLTWYCHTQMQCA